MSKRIVLLGAGGYTATLISERLAENGLEAVLYSRRADAGKGVLALDIQDPAQVEAAIHDGDIVVNCIGPFNLYSRALAAQLARKPVVYLDISGEQSFVSHSYRENDEAAKKSGALLLHACAFESFFAVMLASLCCEKGASYDDISSYYWFENGSPSPGTALTMRLAGHWDTDIYEEGAWVPKAPKAVTRPFQMAQAPELTQAIFVPYPEVEFFPRSFKTRNAASFFAVTEAEAQIFGAAGGPKREIADVLKKHQQRAQAGPTAQERKTQGVGLAVTSKSQGGEKTRLITGRDPYGLSAAVIVWCCARLGAMRGHPGGVLSPAELFSADEFFSQAVLWPEFNLKSN